MGLFGYDKKNYDANTQKMQNMLLDLSGRAHSDEMREKLDCIRKFITNTRYPVAQKKTDLDKIDSRIFEMLGELTKDMQFNRWEAFFLRADILIKTINECRSVGKEKLDAKGIEAERKIFNVFLELEQYYADLEKVQQEMSEKIAAGKSLSQGSAQFEKLHREYIILEAKEKTLETKIANADGVMRTNSKIAGQQEIVDNYKALENNRVMSAAEHRAFAKTAISAKLAFDKENAGLNISVDSVDEVLFDTANRETVADNFITNVAKENQKDILAGADAEALPKEDAFTKQTK